MATFFLSFCKRSLLVTTLSGCLVDKFEVELVEVFRSTAALSLTIWECSSLGILKKIWNQPCHRMVRFYFLHNNKLFGRGESKKEKEPLTCDVKIHCRRSFIQNTVRNSTSKSSCVVSWHAFNLKGLSSGILWNNALQPLIAWYRWVSFCQTC